MPFLSEKDFNKNQNLLLSNKKLREEIESLKNTNKDFKNVKARANIAIIIALIPAIDIIYKLVRKILILL